MKMVISEYDGIPSIDLYGDDDFIQLSKYVDWRDVDDDMELHELFGLGRDMDLDDMEDSEKDKEWNKFELMDTFKIEDIEYEVVRGNPDMLMSEILDKVEDSSIIVNIEGKRVEDMELGRLMRLFIQNDISMTRSW